VAPAAYQQPAVGRTDSAETASSPLPLKPRASANHAETGERPGGLRSVVTVGGSLAVVLGIFFLIVWVLRRASPSGSGTLPAEAFEVLGRAPLANRQQVHLLRCGNKLLLVAVGAAGATTKTLTEITDPVEVDRLVGLCRQARPASPAATFRQVFRQVEDRNA
jgi:flagellar biogenesis protein FliO